MTDPVLEFWEEQAESVHEDLEDVLYPEFEDRQLDDLGTLVAAFDHLYDQNQWSLAQYLLTGYREHIQNVERHRVQFTKEELPDV